MALTGGVAEPERGRAERERERGREEPEHADEEHIAHERELRGRGRFQSVRPFFTHCCEGGPCAARHRSIPHLLGRVEEAVIPRDNAARITVGHLNHEFGTVDHAAGQR